MPVQNSPAGSPILKLIAAWRPDWPRLVCGAILAAGAIAVYSRTLPVPLLYDDNYAIVDNPSIRHWNTALWPSANRPASGRPLLNLSLAINYAISGTAVWSYHALNLSIHVLAGLTLFAVVRRTLRRPVLAVRFGPFANPLALAASAIWLWHPVLTESVTYLSQRAESLMGLFYLLTLYCFVRGEETNNKGNRLIWFALSVFACLAGVATKEVIVTAPLIVFLYDRTFISGSFSGAWRRHRVLYVALAATWLPLGSLMISPHNRAVGFGKGVAWWAYGLTECRAIVRYLALAFWPSPLVFDYGTHVTNRLAEVWPQALALISLLTATFVALRRLPAAGFAACWFFLILAPTSSIVPVVAQPMAENRLYLPLVGVAAFAVLGVFALVGRWSLPVFALVAAGLGLTTIQRNQDYTSEQVIWSDTVAKRPNNARAHYNLGVAWSKMPGRLNDAIAQYEAALRLQPDYAEAHNNLGLAWAQMPGRLNDAIAQYEAALRLKPDSAEAHNNLGNAWSKMPGRLNDAVAQFEAALRLRPDYAAAHNNLGLAWSKMPGRLNDAIAEYEAALRLQPDFAQAHDNLGVAWAHKPGRLDDAVAEFEAALRLQPDFAGAHNNLGLAWAQMPGRLSDAVAQFEEAIRLQPDYTEAHYNLGNAWSEMPGRLNDAIAQYQAALRLRPDFAPGWHNLGASWFQLGNLPAAAAAFREELRLSPNDSAAQQALAAVLRQAEDH
jgi:tetratricopeptide (TPR) repeat protein